MSASMPGVHSKALSRTCDLSRPSKNSTVLTRCAEQESKKARRRCRVWYLSDQPTDRNADPLPAGMERDKRGLNIDMEAKGWIFKVTADANTAIR